ncbi:hypothetical protein K2173_002107 [Erythroxylum novogranatense]|uniref:Uncharacterized protein n=1 Tax=Erythroxylum novogranatense TaxID=1862640 RepID=A0AAV8SPH0_9ROSI|nr:hypothetical protein K2173_002107 [Erythroxylum novogranatense]
MKGCSTLKTKKTKKTKRKRSSSSKKMKATDHDQVLNPTPLSQILPLVLFPSTKNTVDEIIVINSQPLSEPPTQPALSPSTMNTGDEIIILNPQSLSEVPPTLLLKPNRKKYDFMRPNTQFYDGTRYGLPPGWLVKMRTHESSKKVDQVPVSFSYPIPPDNHSLFGTRFT